MEDYFEWVLQVALSAITEGEGVGRQSVQQD